MMPKLSLACVLCSLFCVTLSTRSGLFGSLWPIPGTGYRPSRTPGYYPDYEDEPYYPSDSIAPSDGYPEGCRYGECDEDFEGDDYGDGGYSEALSCSCALYVDYQRVFHRRNSAERFSCTRYGLDRCSRYCDNLFRNDDFRADSRQDACDVMGRDVNAPWYRRNQVCGLDGPFIDVPLRYNLCCRRGRPSSACSGYDDLS